MNTGHRGRSPYHVSVACLLLLCGSASLRAQTGPPPIDSLKIIERHQPVTIDSVLPPQATDTTVYYDEEVEVDSSSIESYSEESNTERETFLPLYIHQDSFVQRRISATARKKLSDDPDFWYANYPFKKKGAPEERSPNISFFHTEAFQTILWLLIIGGFAAVLILYLQGSNAGLFRKPSRLTGNDDQPGPESDDIFAIDYRKQIARAEAAQDYRLGTRLLFLSMLRKMAEKNIIQYKQDRTNLDYLMQVSASGHYPDFFRLTRHYEYTWYGQFSMDASQYQLVKSEFDQLERQINQS